MNGWDAICAYDAATLNAFFLCDVLARGPDAGSAPLQFVVAGTEGTSWLFDGMRGPISLSFSPTTSLIEATLAITSGSLIEFDASSTIRRVDSYEPTSGVAYAQVVLSMSVVAGNVTDGNAQIDFTGATVSASTTVMPGSNAGANLLAALTSFYQHETVEIPLGRIPNSAPAVLQPTTFRIAMQPANDGSGNAAVLVFVTTTGSAGTSETLSSYPIPSGSNAAVIVSCATFLNALAAPLGHAFGHALNVIDAGPIAIAELVASGSLNLGVVSAGPGMGDVIWSADANFNPAAIEVPYTAMTLFSAMGDGNLVLQMALSSFEQNWSFGISGLERGSCNVDPSLMSPAAAQVTPTNVVTVSLATGATVLLTDVVSANAPDLQNYVNTILPPAFESKLQHAAWSLIGPAYTTALDLSSLANVLGPAGLPFTLTAAHFNIDLFAEGGSVSLEMSPVQQSVAPGETCTFSILGGQIPSQWSMVGIGSIVADGGSCTYTAPKDQSGIAVIEAQINLAENVAVYGLVNVTPASTAPAFQLMPVNVSLAPGSSASFFVSDGVGKPLNATCAIDPPLGAVVAGSETGVWIYTVPESVSPTEPAFTLTATSEDGTQSASANVQALTIDTVTISPSSTTVALSATITLTATSSNASPGDFTWIVASPAGGSIDTEEGNNTSATYHAPATMPANPTIDVYAYYASGSLGLGIATITLT